MKLNGFKWSVVKIILTIVLGLVTFWPQYGAVFLATQNLQNHPFAVSTIFPIWVILLTLILPIPLKWFTQISSWAILIVIIGIDIFLQQHKVVDVFTLQFLLIWGIIEIFLIFGWLLCVPMLWRLFHGVVAVQETVEEHSN